MSRERFLRLLDAAEYLAGHIHEAPGLDHPLSRRRHADPHVRFVYLSCGAEHASGGASAGPRRGVIYKNRWGQPYGAAPSGRVVFLLISSFLIRDDADRALSARHHTAVRPFVKLLTLWTSHPPPYRDAAVSPFVEFPGSA